MTYGVEGLPEEVWPESGEDSIHALDVAFVDMILEQINETKGLHVITGDIAASPIDSVLGNRVVVVVVAAFVEAWVRKTAMVAGVGEVCYIMLEIKGGGVPVRVAGHNDMGKRFKIVVRASPGLDVGKGIDDVDGRNVTISSRDALEATYPYRLIVNKLLVGLKLWNGMDTSALSGEGVVVIDSDDFTAVGVDNVGTGNERYVGVGELFL
jgi:hypothetical protein